MCRDAAVALIGVAREQHDVCILVVLEQAGDARVEIRHMRVPFELIILGCQRNGATGWR